jgi:hypothetical protein
MVTVILKVVEMTLLKYPTWGESFPKIMHMLTMITNEQQTMPYYLSDELASKPCNHNWDNLLLIGLYFTAGSNQTSRLDIKIDKYIWLLFFFLFQSLKACVNTVWQSNYTLSNYDTFIKSIHTLNLLIILCTVDIVTLLFLIYFRINCKRLVVQNTTALESINSLNN